VALVVQKFGGTSVGSIEKIKNVAKRVVREKEKGNDVAVVVSAMAGETNRLLELASEVSDQPHEREVDVLVATGEQVTAALLSIVLVDMGYKAKSYMGHQVKILTDQIHSSARILDIDTKRVKKDLEEGNIIVVAGFQGVDESGNITTLGRGGTDLSAVAVAASLEADICDIFTDVEGVYTTDPNICSDARKLNKISYDEMLEMASLGAKVLQTRSVELAKKFNVKLHVRSTFSDNIGTIVTTEDDDMEKVVVSGVAYNKNEAKVTILKVPDTPGIAAKIFKPITDANIVVDMIIQNISEEGAADLTFTVPKADVKKAVELASKTAESLNAKGVIYDDNIVKVSIVGVGMRTHAGVASKMFSALSGEGINIMMISTSEIKISCVIDEKYTELAVRVLHDAFGMGEVKPQEEG
jgi:aspartate kinase